MPLAIANLVHWCRDGRIAGTVGDVEIGELGIRRSIGGKELVANFIFRHQNLLKAPQTISTISYDFKAISDDF
jgi:hypothetical protein